LARPFFAIVLVTACLACTDSVGSDDQTAELVFTTAVTAAPKHVGAASERLDLEVRAIYDRSDETSVVITSHRETLASASTTRRVSLPLDISACLGDPLRTPSGTGCPVRLVLILWLVTNGVKLDYQTVGPITLMAGLTSTLPGTIRVVELTDFFSTPRSPRVTVGGTVTLVAHFVTIAGDTVSRPVQWVSEHRAIAQVDKRGTVTGISAGRANIVGHWGEGQGALGDYVEVTSPATP
jgi:hypothetical protein